ncbi:hypothetical protein D9758_013159 [Tetrapyrgos nigripes]|uniref:DUF6534 domain-containing protein n=1 Tax=Tetrapyrgos nigripes TaxID=182062 RepID=A0A8H5CFG3_9AGAR|nr:hypothetical protein D9758_013159 [Tetrapyrgos nigripes]
MLLGVMIASCFLGISILQAIYYFLHYGSSDKWYIRALVVVVVCLDCLHQAFITHTVYEYLVTNHNNPNFLNECVWSLLAEVLVNGIIGFIVQCFLGLRVYRLFRNLYRVSVSKRNVVISGLIAGLILAEFGEYIRIYPPYLDSSESDHSPLSAVVVVVVVTGCVTTFAIIGLDRIRTFQDLTHLKKLSVTVNSLTAAGDILIAGSLSFLLWVQKTGFKGSNAMINTLITFSINTGLFTTMFAVASLISILVAPNTFIYILFFFNMGRLYVNSLLATLNGRNLIRSLGNNINGSSFSFSNVSGCDIVFSRSAMSGRSGKSGCETFLNSTSNHRPVSIKVDTTKEYTRDSTGSVHLQTVTTRSVCNCSIRDQAQLGGNGNDNDNRSDGNENGVMHYSERDGDTTSTATFTVVDSTHSMTMSTSLNSNATSEMNFDSDDEEKQTGTGFELMLGIVIFLAILG